MESREVRSQAWSRYWRKGAEHSCAGSFSVQGTGALAGFWRRAFSACAPGACIVDFGTGNGELLKLAWDMASSAGHDVRLLGIDLSRPAPAWFDEHVHGDQVRIIGGTPMEATGLPAGSVDLLVSQFGVEYAEHGRVQAECLRLLGEKGRLAFVIHHVDSVITRVAREELDALAFLRADDGLIATAQALLPHMANARAGSKPTTDAMQARDRFNQSLDHGAQLVHASSTPDLMTQAATGVRQFLSVVNHDNLASLQRQLNAYAQELQWAVTRSAEQVECAMDDDQLSRFLQPFREAGMEMITGYMVEAGQLIGWGVEGRRQRKPGQSAPSSGKSP